MRCLDVQTVSVASAAVVARAAGQVALRAIDCVGPGPGADATGWRGLDGSVTGAREDACANARVGCLRRHVLDPHRGG